MIIHILVIIAMLTGLLFFVATTVGIIRFPDFYSRVHAAGKGDTLSTTLFLGGRSCTFCVISTGKLC